MTKNQKGIVLLPILIIILILGVVGYFVYQNSQRNKQAIPIASQDESISTKILTYTNEKLGFSLKYSPDIMLPSSEDPYVDSLCKELECLYIGFSSQEFETHLDEKSAEGWPGDEGREVLYQKQTLVDRLSAIEFAVKENDSEKTTHYIYVPRKVAVNGVAITIEYPEGDEDFIQTLSTFSFTDGNQDDLIKDVALIRLLNSKYNGEYDRDITEMANPECKWEQRLDYHQWFHEDNVIRVSIVYYIGEGKDESCTGKVGTLYGSGGRNIFFTKNNGNWELVMDNDKLCEDLNLERQHCLLQH